MGCRDEWADDAHLIMDLYIEAPWTWAELMTHVEQVFQALRTLDKPCATTVNVSKLGSIPSGNVLRYLNEIENQMPDNVFASAVIGAPQMVSVFMELIMRMRPRAERVALFAKTREEAHEKIMERYYKMSISESDIDTKHHR